MNGGIDQPVNVGRLGNIGRYVDRLIARLFRRGLSGGGIDVVYDDVSALAGIGQSDIPADSPPSARDERHFVLQSHGVPQNCWFSSDFRR
jgi:hypothetical protein